MNPSPSPTTTPPAGENGQHQLASRGTDALLQGSNVQRGEGILAIQQRNPGSSEVVPRNVSMGGVGSATSSARSSSSRGSSPDPDFSILRHLLENGKYIQNYNRNNALSGPCHNYFANTCRLLSQDIRLRNGVVYRMKDQGSNVVQCPMMLTEYLNNYAASRNGDGLRHHQLQDAQQQQDGLVNPGEDLRLAGTLHMQDGFIVPFIEVGNADHTGYLIVYNGNTGNHATFIIDGEPHELEFMEQQQGEQNGENGEPMEIATFYYETPNADQQLEEQVEPLDLSIRRLNWNYYYE